MKIDISTCFQGRYTIYNEEMQVLSEADNIITNWGMRRLVGDFSSPIGESPNPEDISQRAFINNTKFIWLGTGSAPVSATDADLSNSLLSAGYYTQQNNSSSNTSNTTFSTNLSGDLVIKFQRVNKIIFNASVPANTIVTEIGCNWHSGVGNASDRWGIFSRALLGNTITVNPNVTFLVKYELRVTTNCNKILQNMFCLNDSATPALPNNKTTLMSCPFYMLSSNGEPSGTLNNGLANPFGTYTRNGTPEHVQPLFEDFGLNNYVYIGNGITTSSFNNNSQSATSQDNTYNKGINAKQAKKMWWLHLYADPSVPTSLYPTYSSTITTNLNNSSNIQVSNGGGGGSTVIAVEQQNAYYNNGFDQPSGRVTSRNIQTTQPTPDSWNTKIQFLFKGGQFLPNTTYIKLYPATLGDWDRTIRRCSLLNTAAYGGTGCGTTVTSGAVYFDVVGLTNYGMCTVFESAYNPSLDSFIGFEYNFTFARRAF